MRHIGGFLESRRDDRPQTGAQASGYDATTKEAPTERQRHRLFLSPFQGFVLLMSQSRGFHPRLWSFAPSVLHLGTAINTMNSLRDCKSLYPMRADCKSARTAADRSLLHRLLRPRPHPQPLPFKGRGKEAWPRFPSHLRGGGRKLGRGSPPLEGEGLGVGTVLLALHLPQEVLPFRGGFRRGFGGVRGGVKPFALLHRLLGSVEIFILRRIWSTWSLLPPEHPVLADL